MPRKKQKKIFFVREMSDDYKVDLDNAPMIPKKIFDEALKSKNPNKYLKDYLDKKKHKKAA